MNNLVRGTVIDVNLNPVRGSETGKVRPCIVVTKDVLNVILPIVQVVPITSWSEKKSRVETNIELLPGEESGLTKKSIADCLQTRPIDYKKRMIKKRGRISDSKMREIDKALALVFDLN